MWLYIDYAGRVLGGNPNDMTGNTGWEQIEVPESFNIDMLHDDHGAALYKLVDGELTERSEEERRADWPEPIAIIDPMQKMQADLDYIAMMTNIAL